MTRINGTLKEPETTLLHTGEKECTEAVSTPTYHNISHVNQGSQKTDRIDNGTHDPSTHKSTLKENFAITEAGVGSELGVTEALDMGKNFSTGTPSPTNGDIIEILRNMNESLKGELSSVKSQVGHMTSQMIKVEKDLHSFESRWETKMETLVGRISKLEKNSQSLEKRWDLHRRDQSKELSIIQTGIDSNSSVVLELKNVVKSNQDKWDSLEELENRIKKAADKKFQALKDLIKTELRVEIVEEVRSSFAPNTEEIKEGLATIEVRLLKEVSTQVSTLRAEILEEVRSSFAPGTEEIKESLATIKDNLLREVHSTQASAIADIKFERLKDQALAKRQNLIVLGLAEEFSSEADRRSLLSFFRERMDLYNIVIKGTYRLGLLQADRITPRPLVVRFKYIEDRWAVWNRKGSIKKDQDHPIWLQEDLPKKLREDNRVFNRIVKTARQYPNMFQNVRIKDFQLSINGKVYTPDDVHSLPPELKPERVYTPRSALTCVFFTKHSPLSNHYPSSFQVECQWFACVEQYLAVCRAQLAGDELSARNAMESQDPADHKVILNSLRSNQPRVWRERAEEYILQATRAKFGQNERLADFLIETHPLQLGEASKNQMWGIGLSLDSTEVLDSSKWNSYGNLLGRTLERVRDELIDAYVN